MKYSVEFNEDSGTTIEWIDTEFDIGDLVPFISSIHCDGGEEFEELFGDDFTQLSFVDFRYIEGPASGTYVLCFRAEFEYDESKFPAFADAMKHSLNHIEIKLGFKDSAGDEIDDLYEGYSDVPTEAKQIN